MSAAVRIVEVGPRDGLQNEKTPVSVADRIAFIEALVGAGLGTVVALLAEEGATLEKGAAILTLEVMKMEQTLRAPFAGVLRKIKCKVGDIVGEGVELAELEPAT